jgi:tetratricopeptide (TPR) repeat protein
MQYKARFIAAGLAIGLGASQGLAQCAPGVQKLITDRRYDEAKAQMTAVIAKTPADNAAHECLGRISSAMERHREAVAHYEKAIRINDNVASHHLWLGNALGELADSTSKIKLPFLARRIKGEFERTVQLDPASVDGRSGLVEFYSQAPGVMGGSREKAQEQIREIIKLNPMRGHWKQADLHMREKKVGDAEKEYIAAEQAAPDSAIASYTLGSFYQGQQRWSDAFAVYDRMERRFPAEWLVRFQIGRTAALSGERMERGERELRALISAPPADMTKATLAGAHHRLGMILERQGRMELARAEYQQAVAINPNNADAKKSLAALNKE